jgi:twinkle protein
MKDYRDYSIIIPTGGHGAEVHTTCPQCSPHRRKKNAKCLSVNLEKECWVCHHCDWRGTLKAGVEGQSNPYAWTQKTYHKPEPLPESGLPDKVVQWFAGRGIPEAVLIRNRIAYGTVYMPAIEAETTAILFPFYRGPDLVNIKYRDGNKNFRQTVGAEKILFGLNDVAETTIIVEGEMDKLALETAGFLNAVSVPDGAPAASAKDYSTKFEYLENCRKELEPVQRFILAVDSDEPGQKLEEELARRLGPGRCYRVKWPEDCKDANDVLVKHGAEALKSCITMARPYPVEGVFELADVEAETDALFEHGPIRGISTGWGGLDEFYTVQPGEWTLVTGIPGHGKSEFVDALMMNLVRYQGWSFAVCSPENQPLSTHIGKLVEKFTSKTISKNHLASMSRTEYNEAKLFVQNHFSFVLPGDDGLTIDGLLEKAGVLITRKGVKGLVLDPWNEFEHQRPGNQPETEYISAMLTKIRRFARIHKIHVWLIAHPTKLQKNTSGDYPVPTPYDISGSAHWRNKADNCITVYRDYGQTGHETDVQIHVQKIRFKHNGKEGGCILKYNRITGCYSWRPGETEPIPSSNKKPAGKTRGAKEGQKGIFNGVSSIAPDNNRQEEPDQSEADDWLNEGYADAG